MGHSGPYAMRRLIALSALLLSGCGGSPTVATILAEGKVLDEQSSKSKR